MTSLSSNSETLVAYSITVLVGLVTTFIDFHTYFSQARIAVTSPWRVLKSPRYCHFPTVAFFLLTTALNCLFLYLLQKREIFSKEILVNSLIAGSGATMMLKSKFFTIQKGEVSFGFLWIYEWLENRTLEALNNFLGGVRLRASNKLASQYLDKPNIVERLNDTARDIATLVKIDKEVAENLKKEFAQVTGQAYTNPADRLSALLRILMAYTSFDFVEDLLKGM